MIQIEFECRAVAFIDVLGFERLVNTATKSQDNRRVLSHLIALLKSAIPNQDKLVDRKLHKSLIPKFIYISDCIILSAPLRSVHMSTYNGLNVVVMRAIQISHLLLDSGFILRGGIDVGEVWHGEDNIVGPAYINAYSTEKNLIPPCVALTPAAVAEWESSPMAASKMCIKLHRRYVVNTLHHDYIPNADAPGAIDLRITKYKTGAGQNVKALTGSARRKWQWHQIFLDRYGQI